MSSPIAPPVNTDTCPYCNGRTEIAPASRVYGESGGDFGDVLVCINFPKCAAYVGVHRNTTIPKGTLANAELRHWRKKAHALFDTLWMGHGRQARASAYRRLGEILGVPADQAHIGWCDIERCKVIVAALSGKKATA